MRRVLWRWLFLGVTVLAIVMELVAALDRNDQTEPWTELISTYVPSEVAMLVFGALVAWLPLHFFLAYRRNRKGNSDGP